MIKNLISIFVFFLTVHAFAQKSNLSANLSYPITVGDNFVNQYTGIVDFGIQYRFVKAGPIYIGASANVSYLRLTYTEDDFDPEAIANAIFISPRVFGELDLESLTRLKPMLGIGYTHASFTYKNGIQDLDISDENYNGFNINLGATYDITNRFFAKAQYEFIKIKNDVADQINFNTNFGLLKFGVGVRF